MKVNVHHLGVIQQAEIDLKPLTLFIGPNNAGKTWTAYALAAILGRYGQSRYRQAYAAGDLPPAFPPLDAAIRRVLETGSAKMNLVRLGEEYGETYLNGVARLAPRWMQDFLATARVSFEDMNLGIQLQEAKRDFLKRLRMYHSEVNLSVSPKTGKAMLKALKEPGETTFYFFTETKAQALEELPRRAVRDLMTSSVFEGFRSALYPDVWIFPTERAALSTFQRLGRPTALAEPVQHFWDLVQSAFRISRAAREREAERDQAIQDYIRLAQLLERGILDGKVDFTTPDPDPQREIVFQPTNGVTLEMPIVSSMVKELSPLVLYLRYLAKSGDLIVIDEPEMNLHPEAQARLMEFLAMLVHAGLHVLVTTHSPYMVDHLVNLIKAAGREDPEAIRRAFYLQRTEAFIAKQNISVYLFENGTARNIVDAEGLIDWATFGNVSDRVADIYFDI